MSFSSSSCILRNISCGLNSFQKTGVCDCKTDQNVTGVKCDRCVDGRYGVALGCKGMTLFF